ncbi:MAG: carboxypeptidase regulatory-like domain-containing protein, partial [Chitinophagaceae bacterium]
MKLMFTLLASCFFSLAPFAQTGKSTVTLTVLNEQQSPVEGATVELLRSQDSALVKTAITDKAGLALLENIAPATYKFRVTSVGFAIVLSKPFTVKENESASPSPIHLTKTESEMQGVT